MNKNYIRVVSLLYITVISIMLGLYLVETVDLTSHIDKFIIPFHIMTLVLCSLTILNSVCSSKQDNNIFGDDFIICGAGVLADIIVGLVIFSFKCHLDTCFNTHPLYILLQIIIVIDVLLVIQYFMANKNKTNLDNGVTPDLEVPSQSPYKIYPY
jgi:hypothetical protein